MSPPAFSLPSSSTGTSSVSTSTIRHERLYLPPHDPDHHQLNHHRLDAPSLLHASDNVSTHSTLSESTSPSDSALDIDIDVVKDAACLPSQCRVTNSLEDEPALVKHRTETYKSGVAKRTVLVDRNCDSKSYIDIDDGAVMSPTRRRGDETTCFIAVVARSSPSWSGSETGNRRSLCFANSKTPFLDVTDEVSDISKYPVSGGVSCDVHEGHMRGEGKVALKRLRFLGSEKKVREKFRYEAEIWYRLDHPNVLRLCGLYLDGPALYMVSPWQPNGTLSVYVKDKPSVEKLILLRQIADALAYLHQNDPTIVHGDVKGQNVLISREGNAILCDFGLSMILSRVAEVSGTPTGIRDGGSTRYMAPELMHGDQSKTCSSDTYAYAMLMIEAFSGSHPFPKLRYDATFVTTIISGQRPPCPLDLEGEDGARNGRLWRLIQICWHTQAELRPSMADVSGLMKEIVGQGEMRQCVLKEFVISGNADLKSYVRWAVEGELNASKASRKVQENLRVVLVGNVVKTSPSSNIVVGPVHPRNAIPFGIRGAAIIDFVCFICIVVLSFGPLDFLPFSEAFGLSWIFRATSFLVIDKFAYADALSPGMLVILRFLVGWGDSAITLSPIVIIEVFQEHGRWIVGITSTLLCTKTIVPLILFTYGWTAQNQIHYIAPAAVIGSGYFTLSMVIGFWVLVCLIVFL